MEFDRFSAFVDIVTQIFAIVTFLTWYSNILTECNRCVHPENSRNLFEFAKALRVQMCWANRSHVNVTGPTQSIFEYIRSIRMSSIHRFRLPSAWEGKQHTNFSMHFSAYSGWCWRLWPFICLELQVFGAHGLRRMQSNHWFNAGPFSYRMSELRKIGEFNVGFVVVAISSTQ